VRGALRTLPDPRDDPPSPSRTSIHLLGRGDRQRLKEENEKLKKDNDEAMEAHVEKKSE